MIDPIELVCFLYAVTTVLAVVVLGILIYEFFKGGEDE